MDWLNLLTTIFLFFVTIYNNMVNKKMGNE